MFKKLIVIAVIVGFVVSCKKDDNYVEQLRDRNQQFVTDSISIYNFLNENYITVDDEYNVSFQALDKASEEKISIYKQQQFPIKYKIIDLDGVKYKVYYLNLNEGKEQNPTAYDSILVSYKGNLLDRSQFDWKPNAFWSVPGNNVSGQNIFSTKGATYILPEFKTGAFEENNDGTMSYSGYGTGIMFLPSGLAYFNNAITGVSPYTPIIVTFKLYHLRYRDHDLDGVLNKFEDLNNNGNFYDDDTDGDGIANFVDSDDDGDKIPTKYEVIKDISGQVNFMIDDNGNGVYNYLDKEDTKEYNK